VEEATGHGVENARVTIFVDASERGDVRGFANVVRELGEIDETADEEIEAAVVVVVEPDGAGSPPGSGDASTFSDVGKGAVAIVAIENATAVIA